MLLGKIDTDTYRIILYTMRKIFFILFLLIFSGCSYLLQSALQDNSGRVISDGNSGRIYYNRNSGGCSYFTQINQGKVVNCRTCCPSKTTCRVDCQ